MRTTKIQTEAMKALREFNKDKSELESIVSESKDFLEKNGCAPWNYESPENWFKYLHLTPKQATEKVKEAIVEAHRKMKLEAFQ